jgi:cytoskeleton protein RodZ
MTQDAEASSNTEAPMMPSAGEILADARKKAGLTVQEVAAKLRLNKTTIENIEQNIVDENLSSTFTRGYVKLYAKHLELSQEEVMVAFERQHSDNSEQASLQSFSKRVAKQTSDNRLMMTTYVVVGCLVALFVVGWLHNYAVEGFLFLDSDEVEESSASVDIPVSTTLEPESADTLVAQNDSVITASEALTSTATPAISSEEVSAEIQTEQDAEQSQEVKDLDQQDITQTEIETVIFSETDWAEIVFRFSGDCWINVIDSRGENIAYGVKQAGRLMSVRGVKPFSIVLGAPAYVEIDFQGEAIDMDQFPDDRTARFTLPFGSVMPEFDEPEEEQQGTDDNQSALVSESDEDDQSVIDEVQENASGSNLAESIIDSDQDSNEPDSGNE